MQTSGKALDQRQPILATMDMWLLGVCPDPIRSPRSPSKRLRTGGADDEENRMSKCSHDRSRRRRAWPAATILMPWLAALSVVSAPAAHAQASPAAADPHLARNLAATCANCHGTQGRARGQMKPLAGVPADKIVQMLADYRSGAQPATIMHQIVKGYSDEQIRLIAGWYAAQSPAAR
jgi:cytochrome c553